jgi:hypothetical protein
LSYSDARLGQADEVSISKEEAEADPSPYPEADIVTEDGAQRSCGDHVDNIEVPGVAGIDGSGNEACFSGQGQSYAFQVNQPGQGAIFCDEDCWAKHGLLVVNCDGRRALGKPASTDMTEVEISDSCFCESVVQSNKVECRENQTL